ncbi:MAG: hypothetical protein R3D27_03250 [Hyphomicrobiaceae bacterium]
MFVFICATFDLPDPQGSGEQFCAAPNIKWHFDIRFCVFVLSHRGWRAMSDTPTPITGDIQVNTYTSNEQRYPSIAALDGGGFVVTWSSFNQDGGGWGVYGQRHDALGNKVGGEFRVNSATFDWQTYASVAALDGGGFVVTWTGYAQDGSGAGIYGQRYNANGSAAGSEFRVNTFTLNDQANSSVAALDGGGFVVTWFSYGQDGSTGGIYAQRYDASGGASGPEFRVNSFTSGYQELPSVAALAGGGFVIVWQSDGQDGSGFGIYGQRYNAGGVAIGSEFRVNSFTNNSQALASVAALLDGGFVVTWQSFGQEAGNWGIYGQRYDASGVKVGTEFHVNSHTASDQLRPTVVGLNDGGFVITWSSQGQDGSGFGKPALDKAEIGKANCNALKHLANAL